MPKKTCRLPDHAWRNTRGDYQLCTKCGTTFPCRNKRCGHPDCDYVRGVPIPPELVALLASMGVAIDTEELDRIKKSMETGEP